MLVFQPMTNLARTFLAVAATAVLASCALFPSAHDRAIRRTPSFKAGYNDGCAAANAAGASYRYGPVRDEDLFRQDATYRAGWNTGYSACRRTISPPGSEPGHPVPEPSPGH